MEAPTYRAARMVAQRLEDRFARRLRAARDAGQQELAPEADASSIEHIIDAAFWASLRREEGYEPRISLAFLPPDRAERPLLFERRLSLAAADLARLAPAVERPGIHLGVWRDGTEFYVWGTTRNIPKLCLVVEVVEPGLLVVKYRGEENSTKFVNVGVLQGDEIKLVDEEDATEQDWPALLSSLLGVSGPVNELPTDNMMVQLAVSMRTHRRGGSLLIVPAGTDAWRQSIVHPVAYSITPPFSALAELTQHRATERRASRWQEAVRRAVDTTAGLTAVDGATIISGEYDVLAFGAKIGRREGSSQVERVVVSEPIEGAVDQIVNATQIGGTRHMSAAQFVHDQRDAVAMVASQDGRFTVFTWSSHRDQVHARRVEALLM
jgi:hypothetical protein